MMRLLQNSRFWTDEPKLTLTRMAQRKVQTGRSRSLRLAIMAASGAWSLVFLSDEI